MLSVRSVPLRFWRWPPGGLVRDDSDESLMFRYKRGEVRAFEVLMVRHRGPVFSFILRYVRDRAAAEDLMQETFLRLIRAADSYEKSAKFTTFLFTIARNLCVDASRRGKHRQATSLDAPVHGSEDQVPLVERIADGQKAADGRVLDQELGDRLKKAIEELPDEQREIFLLREVSDLQFNEIAEIVGISENTVKSRMRYALEKLRESLEDYREVAQKVLP